MYWCRVVAFVLLLLIAACAISASFFPIFRRNRSGDTFKVSYWHVDWKNNSPMAVGAGTEFRLPSHQFPCEYFSYTFIALEVVSVATAAIAGLTLIVSFGHLLLRKKRGFRVAISLLTSLGFLCAGGCIAGSVIIYLRPYCSPGSLKPSSEENAMAAKVISTLLRSSSFRETGLQLAESFWMMVAVAGGLLVVTFLECCT